MGELKTMFQSMYNEEVVVDIETLLDEMTSEGVSSIKTMTMKKLPGYGWCTLHWEILEGGECGFSCCRDYSPINGVKGKCKHKGVAYAQDQEVMVTIDEIVTPLVSKTDTRAAWKEISEK